MLRANNLSKSYNDHQVLENIQLAVRPGERIALMGPSGSGKTSLIHILAGLDQEFTGEVIRTTDKTSMVFQDAGLFSYKTVKENIAYPVNGKIVNKMSYQKWLQVCDLQDSESFYPFQLSRGMKQKVALIRGFISQPELVYLDEPFSGIDKASTKKIMDHIIEFHNSTAILIASHTKIPDSFCHGIFRLQ